MKKDLIIKKEFLNANFDENVRINAVRNKTTYTYPNFSFSIKNYKNHDILKLDKNYFFYKRIEGRTPFNDAVCKKIQRDLRILSKIGIYHYMIGLENIFQDLNEYQLVKIKPIENGFILKPATSSLKPKNIQHVAGPNTNVINLSKASKINLFLNVEKLDPNNTLEEDDDIKTKILKHGYVFFDDKFMPLHGENIENPFFDFTNHKELMLIEKFDYLTK